MFPFAPEGGGGNAGHRTAATGAWLPPGAVPTGVRPPLSSSQSPLSSVSACGENCTCSLAPPLPTARGAAGAPFGLAKRETGRARSKEKKRFGALRCSGPPRATGVGVSVQAPIWPGLRARLSLLRFLRLPSRGGWCRPRRGARTHLSCFSFRAFRFATRCPGGHGGVYHTGPKAFRVPVGADAFIGPPVQASAAARRPGDHGGLPTARLGASPGPAGGGDRTHKRTIWRSRPGH